MWCLPTHADAAFVCAMEDVLDTYTRPIDPKRPLVCMDESNKQLLAEVYDPQPVQPGRPARSDYRYEHEGVANLFLFIAPLLGQRWVKVTEQRTAREWAHAMRELADQTFPEAEKIVVVMDNLNTHSPISFYKAFPAPEARRLVERFEFHFTPKHGSWLNIAEIEFSILFRQCLATRIPDSPRVEKEVLAWQNERNAKTLKVIWHFSTQEARVKLKHLYPKFDA